MQQIQCRDCDSIIYSEYSPTESLNDKTIYETIKSWFVKTIKVKKTFNRLSYSPNQSSKAIYLECNKRHLNKYFVDIKEIVNG